MDSPRPDSLGPNEEMERLRSLLVGPDIARISQLEQSVADSKVTSERVAQVLPAAISKRTQSDSQLASALSPTIEKTLELSIERNPEKLAEALSPVMMPAIRKSISQQIKAMMQTLNQTLELGLSARGMRWRFESLRTGRPFAEVVMLRSMVFRVEQVFLVHRERAVLLAHEGVRDSTFDNADLVAAMLSAIQDFVKDSFGGQQDENVLSTLEFEDHIVWIERGPKMVLASVIRGSAPVQFRSTLQDTLNELHRTHREDLDSFSGDTAAFEASAPSLAQCCRHATKESSSRGFSPVLGIIVVAVLAGIAFWIVSFWTHRARENELVRLLEDEPGIVVTGTERTGDGLKISGLRDPLASDPEQFIEVTHLDPAEVRFSFAAYQSLEGALIDRRVALLLGVPSTITVTYDDSGVLIATGSATRHWVESAGPKSLSALGLPLDASRVELPALTELENAVRHVEAVPIAILPGVGENFDFDETGLRDRLEALNAALVAESFSAEIFIRPHWFNSEAVAGLAGDWTARLQEKAIESMGDDLQFHFAAGLVQRTISPQLRIGLPRNTTTVLVFEVRVRP